MAAVPTDNIRLRVYYQFEKPRNGREIALFSEFEKSRNVAGTSHAALSRDVWDALGAIDTSRYFPHVYDGFSECFVPVLENRENPITAQLEEHEMINGLLPRIDVKLIEKDSKVHKTSAALAESLVCDSGATSLTGSWFGIGIIRGKSASNHGSLWRSALQFGASLTFTIGKRYEKKTEGCADIFKTHRQIPCLAFEDSTSFLNNSPIDAKIVVVEYGGSNLVEFKHPKRAMYILGSEDCGVPPVLVQQAHCHVSIPTAEGRPASLNVAAAGSVVLYDRYMKSSTARARSITPHDPGYGQGPS